MKIAIISFTKAGSIVNEKIMRLLSEKHECVGYYKGRYEEKIPLIEVTSGVQTWCEELFPDIDGLIFIGACGIAVRAIAPFVKDKTTDPLVLVIDEKASFVISLLSGHIGGGNELALQLSCELQAIPVITTATDRNDCFAVDVFAKKENLFISDMKLAREISASLLEGKSIGIKSCYEIIGKCPSGLIQVQEENSPPDLGICITENAEEKPFLHTLQLIPRTIAVGIGCKKNTNTEQMEQFVLNTLEEEKISLHTISAIASIDLKKQEPCIVSFAKKYCIPFQTYSKEQLSQVKGKFEESDFVKQVTGVGNVCERAAIISCNNPQIIMKKRAKEGMTIALAIERERRQIQFE